MLLVTPAMAFEKRCGWLANPTPANWSLTDSKGEWELGVQGGYQAPGMDKMPDMTTKGWVKENGNYGYGCACLIVETNSKAKRITRLVRAEPLPLEQCRADNKLKRP
jgi:Protein of unknown function (DUF4087)